MIIVDLILVGLIAYAAYIGTKYGMALIGLELVSFILATTIALLTYHPLGGWVKAFDGLSTSLSNVLGFILVWILVEIIAALVVRFVALPHLAKHIQLSPLNQIGGAVLNAFKAAIIMLLALIVFAGLPLSAGTKDIVTTAFIPKLLLASSGQFQVWLGGGLGHDIGESLNFFTVTAEPESEQRIELGYTTTGKVDAPDEAGMLDLLNRERTSRGLKPLKLNTRARAVARAYSTDMFARGYFSHISLEGKNPFDRMKAAGITFDAAGENLALAPTLQLAHQGLMNSPGHRANILNRSYRTVGIGIIDGGPYGLMITQDFTD
jgi:uncharacterized protein YkwD/uncharacterized membrane protein required for colicin V production